jgi:hypothetical protein
MPVYREVSVKIRAPRLATIFEYLRGNIPERTYSKELETALMAMRAYHAILHSLNLELVSIPPGRIPQEARDLVDLLWYMLKVPFYAAGLEIALNRDLGGDRLL